MSLSLGHVGLEEATVESSFFFLFFLHMFFEWVHWPCRKRCQLNCNNRIGSMLDNHGSAKQYVGIAVTIFTPLLVSEFRYDACKAS